MVVPLRFVELAAAVQDARARVVALGETLKRYFVGRDDAIEAMLVCAAAGEPLLLVGAPGTAKSDLVVTFCEAAGVPSGEYFEYMLTGFTEPNEILGPVDIDRLKAGEYVRRTTGKLPEARVAFLDEIFKSNSAILNTLLTILNERKFYQNGIATPVPLQVLFAATNDIPQHQELDALKDRFAIKVDCPGVRDRDDGYAALIAAGLRNEVYRTYGERPWANVACLDDFLIVRAYNERLMAGLTDGESAPEEAGKRESDGRAPDGPAPADPVTEDRRLYFPDRVFLKFTNLLRALEHEDRVPVSDRQVIKLYKLVRTRAFLYHGGEVRDEDLAFVRHAADDPRDFARLGEKVRALLSASS